MGMTKKMSHTTCTQYFAMCHTLWGSTKTLNNSVVKVILTSYCLHYFVRHSTSCGWYQSQSMTVIETRWHSHNNIDDFIFIYWWHYLGIHWSWHQTMGILRGQKSSRDRGKVYMVEWGSWKSIMTSVIFEFNTKVIKCKKCLHAKLIYNCKKS